MYKEQPHRNGSGGAMDNPYGFVPNDYALAILTQAAMQTNHASDNSSSSYDRSMPRADNRPTLSSITNHGSSVPQEQHNIAANTQLQTSPPDHFAGYALSIPTAGNMETMSFSQSSSSALGRQRPYMDVSYRGIGTEITTNYASNLGILNAESYDDGRHAMNTRNTASMRLKHTNELPFGITDHPRVNLDDERQTESDELERGAKRRRKNKIDDAQVLAEEEEARKKARGRPRVDTKDETAADRRRTQIRMAQRAYRSRKETTISSLEKQVQDLRGTNEEMSNIFISLYDFAVGKGLLQREPEFGRQLQTTTERFLALAKATSNDDGNLEDSHIEENVQHSSDPEPAPRKRNSRAPLKKVLKEIVREVEPPVQPWGGYTVSKDDDPVEEAPIPFDHQTKTRHNELQVITRPSEDNASFPFDFTDIQQYRVELPSVERFSQTFLPFIQPPLPATHSYNEFSFARRIHRGAIERGVMLLGMEHPPPGKIQEKFGFSLMYITKKELLNKLKAALAKTAKESLQGWQMPFLHTGGSGTYYPMDERDISTAPKIRTGFSMGPFSSRITEVQDSLQNDMRCNVPGFGGDFFDPNDVEGYLRGRGLDIPPTAEFITAEIDFSEITGAKSATSSESTLGTLSPLTPRSPVDRALGDTNSYSYNFDFSRPEAKAFPFPLGYADWENNSSIREASNLDPIFRTMQVQHTDRAIDGVTNTSIVSEPPVGEKRLVTISVSVLLESILDHAVCLGRAPGFRPSDVNASIITAIKAGLNG